MVNAVEDALRGRDCVKIADGDFTLIAGGDGIKSNKDTKATKGFVSIDGGTFVIEAGDDGIQAQTYLRIAGGDISIAAVDDCLLYTSRKRRDQRRDDQQHDEPQRPQPPLRPCEPRV